VIRPSKTPAVESAMAAANRWLLRRHFHAVHAANLEAVRRLDRSRPVLLFGNHSCWWDGLVAFHLGHDLFGFDQFMPMEERQMHRYAFFRRIGAFSVDRTKPRSAAESVRFALSLFDRPNRALWIYPQGEMLPNDARPLVFLPGLVRIAERLGNAQLLPVAHRYEFMMEQRPEVFVAFGDVRDVREAGGAPDRLRLGRELQADLTVLLDRLRERIAARDLGAFTATLRGRTSTNILFDRARMRRAGARPS
jgi:1-acyl-sn-glycerol-3-phosphate acyltransferase